MIEKLRGLLVKYRQQVAYLIVGVLTTAVNYIIYAVMLFTLGEQYYILDNVVSWVGAVTFSYFANSAFVYKDAGKRSFRQAGEFALSRLFSLGLETLLLFLLVDLCHMNSLIAKLVVAAVVVVVNYLTGLLVYRKREK